mgnify:CR=1 FL=1
MQIQTSRRRARRGSAILESSFVFLGFFAMMLGSFDFAQFLFLHQAIVERTRYAARWGAINDATADQITNMVLYYQSTTPSGSTGYFNMTSTNVAVTRTTDKICVVQDATVYPTLYKRVQVQIKNYPFVMMSLFTSGSHNGPNITVGVPVFLDFATTQTTNCG